MHKFLFTLLLSITGLNAFAQTNLYVDSSVNSSGNGGSWTTAYKTLNEALNTANNGGTTVKYILHLAKGTYYPTGVQSRTARDSSFGIFRGGIQLLGGYPSGGGARNTGLYPSILSGNIGAATVDTDNSHHIMVVSGVPATADSLVLDGLSFTSGYARNYSGGVLKIYNGASFYTDYGGALYQKSVTCPGVINDCNFYGNSAYEQGGAICNSASYLPIAHCRFTGNTTTSNSQGEGGAVYNYAYSPTISYCTFTGNNTNNKGGAIFNFSTATGAGISYCTFTNNGCREDSTGYGAGGAIYESSTQLAPVTYCTFTGNYTIGTTGDGGGAIFHTNYYPSSVHSPYVNYCTFTGNSSNRGGAVSLSSFCAVMNSTFTGNKASEAGGAIARTGLGGTMNCTFTNDTAVYGGALYNCGATDCRLISNYAAYGGGAYSRSINSYLARNVFSGNVATVHGGGLYWRGTFSSNSNLLFSGNKAYGNGGAIYDTANSTSFVHCTFSGDTAAAGNGIYNINASGSLINCIVWEGTGSSIVNANSTVNVSYSLVQGGYPGTGNIAANPLFMAPLAATAAPTPGGNYQLQLCSPAISIANNADANSAGPTDLAGNLRIMDNGPDMGSYEYQDSLGLTIGGGNAVCINDTLQLSNDYLNGMWSVSNPAIATVSTTGLVTGVSAGTVYISYMIYGGCANITISKNITVNALPVVTPITGSSLACTGSLLQLGNATTGGLWASSNPGIATVNSAGTITPLTSGNAGITYTITNNNGCHATVSKSIAINTSYRDTMTAVTCAGTPYVFAGQPLNAAGIYHHLYQTVSGCDSNVALVLSVTNINATASLSGTTLTASPAGAAYQWIDCNGNTPIPGATGQRYTPAANGQYAVRITKDGCTQTSACKSVTTVGMASVEGLAAVVLVSPNPVSGMLTINTGKQIADVILIKDIAGKMLAELHPEGAAKIGVDMRAYLPGIYLLDIYSGRERYRTRVSVVH